MSEWTEAESRTSMKDRYERLPWSDNPIRTDTDFTNEIRSYVEAEADQFTVDPSDVVVYGCAKSWRGPASVTFYGGKYKELPEKWVIRDFDGISLIVSRRHREKYNERQWQLIVRHELCHAEHYYRHGETTNNDSDPRFIELLDEFDAPKNSRDLKENY